MVAGIGALYFRPQGNRAMCFENNSKFRNRFGRQVLAGFGFEISVIITHLYTPREAKKNEIEGCIIAGNGSNSISKLRGKTVPSGLVDEAENTKQTGAFGSKQNDGYVA